MIEWRPFFATLRDGTLSTFADKYGIVSACGRFSIARVTVAGVERFEAMVIEGPVLIGSAPTGGEARELVAAYAGEAPSAQAPLL